MGNLMTKGVTGRFIWIKNAQHATQTKRQWKPAGPYEPIISLSRIMQDILDVVLPMRFDINPIRKTLQFVVIGAELRISEDKPKSEVEKLAQTG